MAQVIIAESSSAPLGRRQILTSTFESYRTQLDAANERRERLIITSRTITQLSKKLIFHLHRGATLSNPHQRTKNLVEARAKEREIWAQFVKIRDELLITGTEVEEFWKWSRQVSPGLEEYIEGLSFLHYLEHQVLISLDEIQRTLSSEDGGPLVLVTAEDYVLGMSDLTGELMRYATNGESFDHHLVSRLISLALSTGDHQTPLTVCQFVREVKEFFDSIPPHMVFKLNKKQEETARSMEKIEKVCYALRLRLLEFADRPDILRQMAKRALEDANNSDVGKLEDS